MTSYLILFPADREDEWAVKTPEERQAVYDTDLEFGRLLEQRDGMVTGGAELDTCQRAHSIRRGPHGTALTTDGPYAESAEQLSGFYVVSIDDEQALLDAAQVLVKAHPAVEIRPIESQGD
ncbi:MAG TPA: YciI family protein [Nocardioides sp.]|jgi:hypothetical protein|uniref:YciI family protein n=1 Tax=Nocardioides sp. TaxID=35761 RepID=UPI002E2F9982|nr:YciI family protein [Nocardioides sp.]HEX3929944.1 YciI family protein [Nocardioides sp.]